MTETPQGSPRISRRSIAKGAAWAAPVVIASQAAAAHATSPSDLSGTACKLFFGSGTITAQRTNIYLGFKNAGATIPKGTVVTWTLKADSSTAYYAKNKTQAPQLVYSGSANNTGRVVKSDTWTLESDVTPGAKLDDNAPVTITWTANEDVTTANVNCGIWLIWDDTDEIVSPGTTLTIEGLSFKVPCRQHSNNRPSKATRFISSADGCYPQVNYSHEKRSNWDSCGDGGNDTSTYYPVDVCKMTNDKNANTYLPPYGSCGN